MTRHDRIEQWEGTISVRTLDDGDTVLYDPENRRAWIRSSLVVDIER